MDTVPCDGLLDLYLADRADNPQLYQPYSHVPLLELWGYERRQRLLTAILFSGYPAFAALAAIMYSKLHLGIFYRIYGNPYSRTMYVTVCVTCHPCLNTSTDTTHSRPGSGSM